MPGNNARNAKNATPAPINGTWSTFASAHPRLTMSSQPLAGISVGFSASPPGTDPPSAVVPRSVAFGDGSDAVEFSDDRCAAASLLEPSGCSGVDKTSGSSDSPERRPVA